MLAAFALAIVLGSALLFFVQPLLGRLLLPGFGGTPMVWNTCMVFFQVVLLLGYVYAHVLSRVRSPRRQLLVHALVMAAALLALPVGFAVSAGPAAGEGAPALRLLATLALTAGLPLFVVSAGAPLLQRWFSRSGHRRARDPYFLYAASNAGSLGALLAYPVVVEPLMSLGGQRLVWSAGFVAYAGVVAACGVVLGARAGADRDAHADADAHRDAHADADADADADAHTDAHTDAHAPPLARRLLWALLAFIPSSLMLGATQQVTTDVAAVPMFWVVPLAIYLVTYVIAFAPRVVVAPWVAGAALVPVAVIVLASLSLWSAMPVSFALATNVLLLLCAGLACHGRLAALRPDARHLTGFYLWIAIGGAAGGLFNAIVAPALFSTLVEYPLVIALAVLVRPGGRPRSHAWRWLGYVANCVVVTLAAARLPVVATVFGADPGALLTERTFFGVHRVRLIDDDLVVYYNGTTLHGVQDRAAPRTVLSYYHDATGLGRLFASLEGDDRLDRVGVVGLGTGTLAGWAAAGQRWTFYEIDPAVARIARDPALFTYLRDAAADVDVVIGDGRLALAGARDGAFGLVVLDAFSSDAIPVHLLTAEAFDLYFAKLLHDGVLAVNVSNRHIDLRPVLARHAAERGLIALEWRPPADEPAAADANANDEDRSARLRFDADWVIVARGDALAALTPADGWHALPALEGDPEWTDDFSNILGVLKWWRRENE